MDCDDTFRLVVLPATIRTVLGLAMGRQWSIHPLHVKNAFLHGDLQEAHIICINLKALLTNDFRIMFVTFARLSMASKLCRYQHFVLQLGFVVSQSDNSLFTYQHSHNMAYLLLYVDNIILCISSDSLEIV